MTEFDPIEGLVALGVVTRAQADAAARVPLWVSASRVGRLVHAGVDQEELLPALSTLTGIPVATRQLMQRAERFSLPPQLVRKMRDLTACPVRRDDAGTVHILISEPEARDEVARHLLNFRVYLAGETEVRGLLEHLWPLGTSMEGAAVLDGDTEPGEPTLSDSQPPEMPMPPPRTATPPPAPPRRATPPPRAATPPPALPRAAMPPPVSVPDPFAGMHMSIPSASPGAFGDGESVLRTVGKSVERPWEPASDATGPRHAPFNLNAPRGPSEGQTEKAPLADDTIEETLRLPASPRTVPDAPHGTRTATSPTAPSRSAPTQATMQATTAEEAPRRSFLAGSVLGVAITLLVLLLLVGGALMLRGGGDDGGDVRAKQEALLADARASAEKSDHAWAVAKCEQVITLDRTSHAAAAALLLRGKERLTLGDREGANDLREALRLLPIGDPLRRDAEHALAVAGHDL